VIVMHACLLYMFLLCLHDDGHCYSCVSMWNLMMLLLECGCYECVSTVCLHVMHVSVYMLLCIYYYGHGCHV